MREHGLLVRAGELSDGAAVDVQGFADTPLRVLDRDGHVTRRQVNEGRRQMAIKRSKARRSSSAERRTAASGVIDSFFRPL